MAAQRRQQQTIIECGKFDTKKMTFKPVAFKPDKPQGISYINYDNNTFVFKTGETPIRIVQGGIMPINEKTKKFIRDEGDRENIKIPFDPSQESAVELHKMFKQIDEYASSEPVKKAIFGDNASKYKYLRLVKEPNDNDDDIDDNNKEKKEKRVKFEFCKLKFDVDYKVSHSDVKEGEKRILTTLFVNNTGKPEQVDIATISDMEKYVPWNSSVRLICTLSHIWAEKNPKKKGELREYAFKVKVLQMVVTNNTQKTESIRNTFKSYAFEDDETPSKEAIQDLDNIGEDEEVVEVEVDEGEEEEEEEEVPKVSVKGKSSISIKNT